MFIGHFHGRRKNIAPSLVVQRLRMPDLVLVETLVTSRSAASHTRQEPAAPQENAEERIPTAHLVLRKLWEKTIPVIRIIGEVTTVETRARENPVDRGEHHTRKPDYRIL